MNYMRYPKIHFNLRIFSNRRVGFSLREKSNRTPDILNNPYSCETSKKVVLWITGVLRLNGVNEM